MDLNLIQCEKCGKVIIDRLNNSSNLCKICYLKTNNKYSNKVKNKELNECIEKAVFKLKDYLINDEIEKINELSRKIKKLEKDNFYGKILEYISNKDYYSIFNEDFLLYDFSEKSYIFDNLLDYVNIKTKNNLNNDFMVFSVATDYKNYYQKDMDLLIYVLEKNAEYMTDNQKNKLYNCKEIKVKYIEEFALFLKNKYSVFADNKINEIFVSICNYCNILEENELFENNENIKNINNELVDLFVNNSTFLMKTDYLTAYYIFDNLTKLSGVYLDNNKILTFMMNFQRDKNYQKVKTIFSPKEIILSYPSSEKITVSTSDILFINVSFHTVLYNNTTKGKQYCFYDFVYKVDSNFTIARVVETCDFDNESIISDNYKILNRWVTAHKIKITQYAWQNNIAFSNNYLGLEYKQLSNIDINYLLQSQMLDNLLLSSNMNYRIILSLLIPIIILIIIFIVIIFFFRY